MPTSATPKQVFDRALFNELKSLTKPKVDPAMLRRGANAIQRKPFQRGTVRKSDYPPWHVALGDRPGKRDARAGVGSFRSEADDLKRTAYETARDARLNGTTVDAPSDGKVAPTRSARSVPGWDELMEGRGRGAMGAQQRGGARSGAMEFQSTGSRYAPQSAMPRASDGGSTANESASSWDAMVQSTGASSKGRKGAQKGMASRSAAPSAPKAAWEMEFSGRGASQGGGGKGGGKKRKGFGNKRKSSGKGRDATGGFDWGRFNS